MWANARHSSIGCQPNFAALNRGHHLYSAWRPSRWALAHISSCNNFYHYYYYYHHHHLRSLYRTTCVSQHHETAS